MKRNFLKHFTFFLCFSLLTSLAHAKYANVNGINMYYEVHGRGTPLVMLHGGYADSDMWNIESFLLSFKYKVITLDSRGHGRSTDADTPITYEQMADDTLALLDKLNISRAHFVGWSDGAVIASHIAATQPARVNQLVMIGSAYQRDAYTPLFSLVLDDPGIFNAFIDMTFGAKYQNTSPTPDHWPVFRDKIYHLWQSPCYFADAAPGQCLDSLQSISAPTLVVAGNLEIITPSHTQEIAANIPGAELKIVPLAGHFMPIARPFLTTDIIRSFLNN